MLFSCSEYEARNYGSVSPKMPAVLDIESHAGRFLRGVLFDTLTWYKNKHLYEQDNQTTKNGQILPHPGFQRSMMSKPGNVPDILKHEGFMAVVRKWHRKLGKVCRSTGNISCISQLV